MKVIAINGSPRKNWNTATLLEKVLAGAKDGGAETEMVHLYDLSFKGCISCFACKKIGGASYGRCALKDDLTPILDRVEKADAVILGSPVYFFTESGMMRTFMERLRFPYYTYTPGFQSIFPGRIRTALVYTMTVNEEFMAGLGIDKALGATQWFMNHLFGNCEVLLCHETYQFDDYSKYLTTVFDVDEKERRRREAFPQDCARAYDLGARIAKPGEFAKGKGGKDLPMIGDSWHSDQTF